MQDIPLMRAGLALMAATALVGGFAMVVVPRDDDGGGGGGGGRKHETTAAAVVQADTQHGFMAAIDSTRRGTPVSFTCRADTRPVPLPTHVHESSGLALAGDGGGLWTHNDSGDPVLYLVGTDGAARGQVRVAGATVTDWEDVAAGPCAGGRCLYVGDIGDNNARRPTLTIYRVPEPRPGQAQTRPAEALVAAYPDGPHDAEALFVTPDTGVYVVTKGETGSVTAYRLPRDARPGTVARLERVAQLRAGDVGRRERITGAAASPDGRWVALRTLDALHLYRAAEFAAGRPGTPLLQDLRALQEPQGEAVEFGPGGALFLSSEGGKKENPASLARLTCTLPG